jgi:hypothetical protein
MYYGTHATGAEAIEKPILSGNDESAPPAREELFGLEPGEDSFADEAIDEGIKWRIARSRLALRGDRDRIEQAALAAELDEAVDRGGSGHRPSPENVKAASDRAEDGTMQLCHKIGSDARGRGDFSGMAGVDGGIDGDRSDASAREILSMH